MKPSATLRTLLTGVVDYAGLFPPAALTMSDAIERYAEYLDSRDAWALGRLVVPAARLDEFGNARRAAADEGRQWRVSAILGRDQLADCTSIHRFNQAHGAVACIDSVEMKMTESASAARDQIEAVVSALPAGARLFVEVPVGGDMRRLVSSVRAAEVSAKLRTGGVTADAFPSPAAVASFILACADESVSFKATAGLHHPCRGSYPLTYDADAPTGTMFGFLNVLLAAVFACEGVPRDEILAVLKAEDTADFWFGDHEIRWRDVRVSQTEIQESRSDFVLSFGSCSFQEPMQDLRALSLL